MLLLLLLLLPVLLLLLLFLFLFFTSVLHIFRRENVDFCSTFRLARFAQIFTRSRIVDNNIITILLLVFVIFVYRVFSDPSFFCCSCSRCAIFSLNRHAHDRRCPFLACDCDHIAAYSTCLRSFWRH